MAKASISLRSLNETLNRVETKLQTLEAQFTDLDLSLQKLAQKFELQAEMLEKEISQDPPWMWVPGERVSGAALAFRTPGGAASSQAAFRQDPSARLGEGGGGGGGAAAGGRERPVSEGRGGAAGGRAAPRRRPLREAAALPAAGPEDRRAPAAEPQLVPA